jgi:hypothetical protein
MVRPEGLGKYKMTSTGLVIWSRNLLSQIIIPKGNTAGKPGKLL